MSITTHTTRGAEVMRAAIAARVARDRAEVDLVEAVLAWAAANPAHGDDATHLLPAALGYTDTGLTLAGPGAPTVSEFACYELAAGLGVSSDAGKRLVAHALEVAYRLPRLWAQVQDLKLPFWKAGKVAEATLTLCEDAAGFVDDTLAPAGGKFSFALLEHLVQEALTRFDPEEAEARRKNAAEKRHFDVHTDQVGYEGTVEVSGTLDLADALDLDAAISRGAKHLGELGCGESLDVRRSMAAGDLARLQLALDLETGELTTTGRSVDVVVHVSDPTIARYGTHLISVEQVKAWCDAAGTKVTVKPVIDVNEAIRIEAYEVPDRIAEHVELRDGPAGSPGAPGPANAATRTTSPPTAKVGRRRPTTSLPN